MVSRALTWFLLLAFVTVTEVCADDTLPFDVPRDPRVLPKFAILETTKGPFTIELFGEEVHAELHYTGW